MLFLLLLAPALAQQDCTVFQEGACPLEESNILGITNDVALAGDCQTICKYNPTGDCLFFTFLGTQCYSLKSCDFIESCPGCVSGPTDPVFSDCPWPPAPESTTAAPMTTTEAPMTTTAAPMTTTAAPMTTTAAPMTTTTMLTTAVWTTMPTTEPTRPACDVTEGFICEGQIIEEIEHISQASDCQAICQNHPECGAWSHWRQGDGKDHWGHCTLHYSCEHQTDHECFGSDDHECKDVPQPRPPGHKCHCQSGAPLPDLDDCGVQPPTESPCMGEFWPGQRCDEHENTIEHIEHISSASDCQAICQNHPGCNFFTHWSEAHGDWGECWLHWQCDHRVDHECDSEWPCFCGPAYPDMDDCSPGPSTPAL